ncbi:MAG TPA: exodeoxyribonuclease III [Bacteroidales bacterium]|nr:exodeoxyribonuclease III [Bacteroidales bacterium]
MNTKIISYNVNGLRAALSKEFALWLQSEAPDIICLQETKLQQGQVDTTIFEQMGYYHYWHYAQKKGYSGVALFTKKKPLNVFYGIGKEPYDSEGRLVAAEYDGYSAISVYFPSGTTGDIRQEIKMAFLQDFLAFIENYKNQQPNLIISGDFNICHKPIDINHPERHEGYSGFLPEERAWMDSFQAAGYVDSFRVFNGKPNHYSWWSYRAGARSKNLGWRIDYHWVSEPLKEKLVSAQILSSVIHSDHCPVEVVIDLP